MGSSQRDQLLEHAISPTTKNGDAHKVTQEPDSTINSNSKDTPKSKHSTTSKLTFISLLVVALAALLAQLSGASSSDEVFFPPIAANAQYYSEATLDSRNNNNGSSYSGLQPAAHRLRHGGLSNGDFSAVDLVRVYLVRIEEVKVKGPGLRAIIETSPVALEQARKLDAERSQGKIRGPLHGIPIVVKDNVATDASLGMNTTAGSYSLLNSIVPGDSPSISTLRKAGAIIVGKANMSVWAQARGLVNQTQGCSPRGGFGTSAYYPGGNPFLALLVLQWLLLRGWLLRRLGVRRPEVSLALLATVTSLESSRRSSW